MRKLKKVIFVFDDDLKISMESDKEIIVNTEAENDEPYTTVTINFVLSKVDMSGDRGISEFIRRNSANKAKGQKLQMLRFRRIIAKLRLASDR